MTTVEYDLYIRQLNEIFNDNSNLIFVGDININLLEDQDKRVQAYSNTVITNGFNFINKIGASWCTRVCRYHQDDH